MTPEPAAFAQRWVEEWNSHDLDRILEHLVVVGEGTDLVAA